MKKMKRLKATEKEGDMVLRSVYLPAKQWEQIEAEADRIGCSRNATIKKILKLYFADSGEVEEEGE